MPTTRVNASVRLAWNLRVCGGGLLWLPDESPCGRGCRRLCTAPHSRVGARIAARLELPSPVCAALGPVCPTERAVVAVISWTWQVPLARHVQPVASSSVFEHSGLARGALPTDACRFARPRLCEVQRSVGFRWCHTFACAPCAARTTPRTSASHCYGSCCLDSLR